MRLALCRHLFIHLCPSLCTQTAQAIDPWLMCILCVFQPAIFCHCALGLLHACFCLPSSCGDCCRQVAKSQPLQARTTPVLKATAPFVVPQSACSQAVNSAQLAVPHGATHLDDSSDAGVLKSDLLNAPWAHAMLRSSTSDSGTASMQPWSSVSDKHGLSSVLEALLRQ